jgi:adenosylcobyric acid synthase
MVQGTSSSVGKSVIAAALCRILAQNGVNVAPFKAQNMSNNSYVTAEGGEMGRAQVVQAQAAGVEPHTDMNPVLLKPEADSRSQVVVNGKAIGSFEARRYWGDQSEVWSAVTAAYDRLATRYDVIVLEGAGSPAEVNLRDRDIVNMKMAAHANAAVILVGDIDRGGVFASLLGTLELLLPDERAMVKALLINRFRGDRALLDPLPEMIAERTGVPVIGVVPFIHDLQVKDEDGVTFGDFDPPGTISRVPSEVIGAEGPGAGSHVPGSFSLREKLG